MDGLFSGYFCEPVVLTINYALSLGLQDRFSGYLGVHSHAQPSRFDWKNLSLHDFFNVSLEALVC